MRLDVEVDDVGGGEDGRSTLPHDIAQLLVCAELRGTVAPVLPDRSARNLVARSDLVPADRLLSGCVRDAQSARDEAPVVIESGLVRFVSADVDVRPWRDRGDVPEDVLDELVHLLRVGVERREPHLGAVVLRDLHTGRRELGVGDECGVGMPGQVDLGHDGDVTGCRIADELLVVLGREKAAVAAADLRRRTAAGELRPARNLQPPALIIGEVQMQVVELERGHTVDDAPDGLRAEEVPRDVEHDSAVRVAWGIHDLRTGNRPGDALPCASLDLGGQQLAKCLDACEQACLGLRLNGDELGRGGETVALGTLRRGERVERGIGHHLEHDVAVNSGAADNGQREAGGRAQKLREVLADVSLLSDDAALRGESEGAVAYLDAVRVRNQGRNDRGHRTSGSGSWGSVDPTQLG